MDYATTSENRPGGVSLAHCPVHRRDPEFLYVAPADVLRIADETGAIPYDIPGWS